jgi:hypothetical protein
MSAIITDDEYRQFVFYKNSWQERQAALNFASDTIKRLLDEQRADLDKLAAMSATITTQAKLIAKLKADVATMEVTEYEAERFAPEYKRQIEEPLEQRIKQLEAALAAHPAPEPVTP